MDNRSRPNAQNVTGRASALYDYVGSAQDELAFNAGDQLEILSEVPADGWFTAYNTRSRQSGLVPSNYVEMLPDPVRPSLYNATVMTADTETEEVYDLTIGITTVIGNEPASHSLVDNNTSQVELRSSTSEFGTVIEDHNSENSNELTVTTGDIVEILMQPVNEWVWIRDLSTNLEGYIPVEKLLRKKKLLSDTLRDALSRQSAHLGLSTKPPSPEVHSISNLNGENSFTEDNQDIVVRAAYDYNSRGNGELTISASEELIIINKTEAWTYVKSKRSQQSGYVPTEYLQLDLGNVTEETTDDHPNQDRDNLVAHAVAKINCDKGSHVKKGDEVEVLEETDSGYILIRKKGSQDTFYTKSEDLDHTSYYKNTVQPSSLHNMISPKHSQVTRSTTSTPPLPLSSKPKITSSPVHQDRSSCSIVHRVASIKCDKGGPNSSSYVKRGEEIEVMEETDSEFILIRKKGSQNTFYTKKDDLDFTLSNHATVPPVPSHNTIAPKQPQMVTKQTRSPPPLPLSSQSRMTSYPVPQETTSNQAVHRIARLKHAKGFVSNDANLHQIAFKNFMKDGEELEILDTSSPDYPFVRHKKTGQEFYIMINELDLISSDHDNVPLNSPPDRRSSEASQIGASSTNASQPTSRTLPTHPIPQGTNPNVPLKPSNAKDQVPRMKSPPPDPPNKRVEIPPRPRRNVNSAELLKDRFLLDKEYYMSPIDKKSIKPLLFGPGTKEGTFIVRKSTSVEDEYAISVRYEESVKHYRIKLDNAGLFYVNDGETFQNVVTLVTHYQNNGGLQHNLVEPFNRAGAGSVAAAEGGTSHNFQVLSYKSPSYCAVCKTMLYGLVKQGMQCQGCKMNIHTKCKNMIKSSCSGQQTTSIKVSSKPAATVLKTTPPGSSTSCPICFESLETLKSMSRQMYSTGCGHIFCSHCLTQSLKNKSECPTCRKWESMKNCHPIFL